MKNKSIFIRRLISSIFITLFLLYLSIKSQNIKTKIIIIPFFICSTAILGKNIFLIMNKKKYVKLFNQVFIISFLLFMFSFLIFWSYTSFINKKYLHLLLTLPFWLIGIYIINKSLIKRKNNNTNSNIKNRFNFKIIISSLLVLITLLSGIIMLFFGIKDTYKLNKETKSYLTINGYFNDYEIYNSDEDGTTYKLIYIYTIDNKEYTISTDYGTNYIPEKNSIREIKYNPDKPEEAILVGTNSKNGLIFIGAFFTMGSFAFILGALTILGYFDKFKIDIIGTYIGIVFLVIGLGIILFQTGTTMSLTKTIKSFGLWILIPLMFILVGIFQIAKCLFIFPKNNSKKK